MKNIRWWSAFGLVIVGAVLAGCGGGGGSNGNVRLVNATLTHASLDLILSSDSSKLVSDVAQNTVSSYASVSTNPSLQLVDSGSTTSLYGTTPSLAGGQHLAILAYQIDGVVQTALIGEDITNPSAGFFNLRVYDAAVDAGSINIYLVSPGSAPPTSSNSPTFALTPQAQVASIISTNLQTKNYDIYVTGQASATDVRLKIANFAPADAQNTTLILTPTSGGVLVNGATLVQQGVYTPAPTTSARVRLVAAVSGANQVVAASVGGTQIGSMVSPSVGTYTTVSTASSSTIAVTVNGTAITAPTTKITAGSDATLLIYGNEGAAAATLIADDNHGSPTAGNVKVRLINALNGSSPPSVTWKYGGAVLNTPVAVGTASSYYDSSLITGASIDVQSASSAATIFSTTTNLLGNQVYSVFLFGDGGSPSGVVLDSAD